MIDKTVIEAPFKHEGFVFPTKADGACAMAVIKDRVVLVFKCDCGKVKVIEK